MTSPRFRKALASAGYTDDCPATVRLILQFASENPGLKRSDFDDLAYWSLARKITKQFGRVVDALGECRAAEVADSDVRMACRRVAEGRLSIEKVEGGYALEFEPLGAKASEYRWVCASVLREAVRIAQARAVLAA